MPSPVYDAPTKDAQFLLEKVFDAQSSGIRGYEDLDADFTSAILDEAAKLARNGYAPINQMGDDVGCQLENGVVRTPPGFKEAFQTYRAGGWNGMDLPSEYGGQDLPFLMYVAVSDFFCAANTSLVIYSTLTHGAASTILAHGTKAQKDTFLPPMISAEWTGTMNLTEPHCGTDLGLMRTKAEPQDDGTYKISGQKIFISAGDHDLSENVVHLVLAKIPGGPKGVKGISLFIVPKFLVNEDGSVGARNGVSVGSIETKMGIHGNATCVMNYDGATGYLLGAPHKGMRAMFTMMNEARLNTSLQGVSLGERAYQAALAYAKERLQGRAATGVENPDGPADPLIVHPDIRRSLLEQKSYVEGGRGLAYWVAQMIDRSNRNGCDDSEALVSLLTPVLKGFLSDKGFEMTIQAQQILGGHGYIEEWSMSQFARDARISQIYEGANGVQALDLVARKLPADGGKALMQFFGIIDAFLRDTAADAAFTRSYLAPLESALTDLKKASEFFMQSGMKGINDVLSGSYDYMHLFGQVCMGYIWAKQAVTARDILASGTDDTAFYDAKLKTARFYMSRQLLVTSTHLARILSGADPVMEMAAEQF
jgi:alkylation response protein AidB-like acyl-CoA dehydrogenase